MRLCNTDQFLYSCFDLYCSCDDMELHHGRYHKKLWAPVRGVHQPVPEQPDGNWNHRSGIRDCRDADLWVFSSWIAARKPKDLTRIFFSQKQQFLWRMREKSLWTPDSAGSAQKRFVEFWSQTLRTSFWMFQNTLEPFCANVNDFCQPGSINVIDGTH